MSDNIEKEIENKDGILEKSKKALSFSVNLVDIINELEEKAKYSKAFKVHGKDTIEYASNLSKYHLTKSLKYAKKHDIDLSPKDINRLKHIYNGQERMKFTGKMTKSQIPKYNNATNMLKKDLPKNPKMQKLIKPSKAEKIGNGYRKLKNINFVKKTGDLGVVKGLSKAFSVASDVMNVQTMMNSDESNFKRLLAGADLVADKAALSKNPYAMAASFATSTANFAGGLAYDFLKDKSWGKPITNVLDKGAGVIVSPIEKAVKSVPQVFGFMKKGVAGIKKHGFVNSLKAGLNVVNKKSPQPIKKALKGYTNMYLRPIETVKNAGTFLGNKIKNILSKPKLKDYNDIYYRNLANSKNKQPAINHNGEVVQTKLQGSHIDNSNKNNFTININGTNKSTQEIMNEIVPEIKLRMKNISVA